MQRPFPWARALGLWPLHLLCGFLLSSPVAAIHGRDYLTGVWAVHAPADAAAGLVMICASWTICARCASVSMAASRRAAVSVKNSRPFLQEDKAE